MERRLSVFCFSLSISPIEGALSQSLSFRAQLGDTGQNSALKSCDFKLVHMPEDMVEVNKCEYIRCTRWRLTGPDKLEAVISYSRLFININDHIGHEADNLPNFFASTNFLMMITSRCALENHY